MLTEKDFWEETTGYANQYSSFLIIGASLDQVLEAINSLRNPHFDPKTRAANGYERPCRKKAFGFDIWKSSPSLIYYLTCYIHNHFGIDVVGYADEGWEEYEFEAAKNGDAYDGFTAGWTQHGLYEDGVFGDGYMDAFFEITDKESGVTFATGAGCISKEDEERYAAIVDAHH